MQHSAENDTCVNWGRVDVFMSLRPRRAMLVLHDSCCVGAGYVQHVHVERPHCALVVAVDAYRRAPRSAHTIPRVPRRADSIGSEHSSIGTDVSVGNCAPTTLRMTYAILVQVAVGCGGVGCDKHNVFSERRGPTVCICVRLMVVGRGVCCATPSPVRP